MNWEQVRSHLVGGERIAHDPKYYVVRDVLLPPQRVTEADVVLMGVPFDGGTFRHVGANAGPPGIREVLLGYRTYSADLEIDIADYLRIADVGNVDLHWNSYEDAFRGLDLALRAALSHGQVPVVLGGDHSISYQGLKTFREATGARTGVIWFDNHLDTMDAYHGDRFYCGCPLFYLFEEGLLDPADVVMIGPRGFTHAKSMWEAARRFGFRIVKVDEVMEKGIAVVMREAIDQATRHSDKLYLTVDIDAADAVYAPGTEVAAPGGLTAREMMYGVRAASLAGAQCMDLAEVAPPVDIGHVTCKLAAELVLGYLAGMANRRREAAAQS